MNYDLPAYDWNEKVMPLDGFAVGGFNYGWPYEVTNKAETDGFLQQDWLLQENGYLPQAFNALGTDAFGPRKLPPLSTSQNSGAGYGMKVLHPRPTEENAKAVPKQLRLTKTDERLYVSPVLKLAKEQLVNEYNFGTISVQPGAQWNKDRTASRLATSLRVGTSF